MVSIRTVVPDLMRSAGGTRAEKYPQMTVSGVEPRVTSGLFPAGAGCASRGRHEGEDANRDTAGHRPFAALLRHWRRPSTAQQFSKHSINGSIHPNGLRTAPMSTRRGAPILGGGASKSGIVNKGWRALHIATRHWTISCRCAATLEHVPTLHQRSIRLHQRAIGPRRVPS